MTEVDSIRARHEGARPDPTANPAWANCERDVGVLLAEIERLTAALRDIASYTGGSAPAHRLASIAEQVLDFSSWPSLTDSDPPPKL